MKLASLSSLDTHPDVYPDLIISTTSIPPFDHRSGIGCWLLPESSREYHRRGELIQASQFDFHDMVCSGGDSSASRTGPEVPGAPEGGAGTRPAPTGRPGKEWGFGGGVSHESARG